jgi:hypothetical protein
MHTLYQDADRDGYGNPDIKKEACNKKSEENGPQENAEAELKRIDLQSLGASVEAEFSNDIYGKKPENLIDSEEHYTNIWRQTDSKRSWI